MNMKKLITRFLMTGILTILMFPAVGNVFAGDPGCQSGYSSQNRGNGGYGRPALLVSDKEQKQQFAAAQINYEQDQPPGSESLSGSDTLMRMRFSFLSSLFLILGGIWLLFVLLRNRFITASQPSKINGFLFKPSFALSIFSFLLVGVIVGSALTSMSTVSVSCAASGQTNENQKSAQSPAAVNEQPVFRSAQQIGGNGYTQIGAPVFDASGNRYVRGGFIGTLTIGATTLTATSDMDMFIAKYDASGNALWARQGSGLTNAPSPGIAVEGATAMAIYEDNQPSKIYVAGSFVKTLTLQGSSNSQNITLTDASGGGYNYESFIAKYDGDGNLLWAKGGNSGSLQNPTNLETGQNAISRIVFDYNGDPFVSGSISGGNFLGAAITDFICFGQQNCALHGKTDIIVAKLNQNTGTPTQVKILGGSDDDNALDLAIFNDGAHQLSKLYLVGNFSSAQIALPTTSGGEDVYNNPDNSIGTFVTRLQSNSSGTSISSDWGKVLDNDGIIGVNQITTNPSNGDAFITGYFTGTISLPVMLGGGTITNTRTGTGDAAVSGFVASLNSENGNFFRITKLGGAGHAIAFGQSGDLFIVGALYDTAEFAEGTGSAQTLDSFGASDLYVANFDKNTFGFNWAKASAARGTDGVVAIGNPTSSDGRTKNRYSPLGITFYAGRMYISGDFEGTLSLDCITLTTTGGNVHSYIAELGLLDDPTTCRILTNPSTGSSNWNNPENWNGGIIPAANDSVYLPYRKFPINQIYNPQTNVQLNNLSISGNQTLGLQQNLNVNGRLDLLGGLIDAGSKTVTLGANGQTYNINGGRVNGQLNKQFSSASGSFMFPVGTANGYSPVTLSNISGSGTFSVTANQGTYPNTATNLPANRANRWWTLNNSGLTGADVTFQYLSEDITSGVESNYRAFRIENSTAMQVNSVINTAVKTVTAPNVTQFSDWTLAESLAPTAATATVGGRVMTANGRGAAQARVTLTNAAGESRFAVTNAFGYYSFAETPTGTSYILNVVSKRYKFPQPTQVLSVTADYGDINFIAAP